MGTRKKGDEGDDLKPGQHLWEFHVDGTKYGNTTACLQIFEPSSHAHRNTQACPKV